MLRWYRYPCAFLLACSLTAGLQAQPVLQSGEVPVAFDAAQARFEHLTVMDGLPENSANALLQDHLGFIWMGTQNGLARYDGQTIVTYQYDPEDPYSFGGQNIMNILEDADGDLWLATLRNGLVHYDRASGRFTTYRHDPEDDTSISGNEVQSIYEDRRGDLWVSIGHQDLGTPLDRLNRATGTFTRFRHDPDDPKTLSNNLVFATPSFPQGWPMALHEEASGTIWMGTFGGGLNRFDPVTETFTHYRHDPEDPGTLSDDVITVVTADRAGKLWIGTRFGLNLFDPETGAVTRYRHDPDNPQTLVNNAVFGIYEDKKGHLWLSTAGGLDRFDPETKVFTHYASNANPTDASAFLFPLHEDGNGFWMSKSLGFGELVYFDRTTEALIPLKADPNNPNSLSVDGKLLSFLVDRTGTAWAGHRNRGVDKQLPPQPFQHYVHDPDDPQSISDNRIGALYEAPSEPDILWIGTETGLDRLDRATGKMTHFRHDARNPRTLTGGPVLDVYEDRSGGLWVGTEQGLNRMDRRTGRFQRYEHDAEDPTSLPHPEVSQILQTPKGMLWLGTYGGGLSRFDPATETFTTFGEADSTYHPDLFAMLDTLTAAERRVGAILHLGDDVDTTLTFDLKAATEVLVVAMGEVLVGVGSKQLTDYGWLENEGGEHIWEMQWDKTQAAGGEDFHRMQTARLTLEPGRYRLRFLSNFVNSYSAWARRPPDQPEYWGIQLLRVTAAESAVLDTLLAPYPVNGLLDDNVFSLHEDMDGMLWVGTNQGGLGRFDPATGIVTANYKDEWQGPFTVGAIHEDQTGALWVSDFRFGLFQMDEEARPVKRYTIADGLPGETKFLFEDDDGYFWVGGLGLLVRLNPETEHVRLFDAWHGIPGSSLNNGARAADGAFFFGSNDGFFAFDPRTIADDPVTPQVVLTAFQLDGVNVPVGSDSPLQANISVAETITLNHTENDFTFGFAALHFTRPERNTYAYRLAPYEADWSTPGTASTARYTNLSPGTYTFNVKAANPDGQWNEAGTSIRVVILPPWWRTIWAYLLYGLTLLGGIFTVDRIQRRRLITKERQRAEVAQERLRAEAAERELEQAREIEQAYTQLKATQAQLVQQEKMASLGQLTAGIAHEIKNPLNFVNNFAGLNAELLDELQEAFEQGDQEEIQALLSDLSVNTEKIEAHGQRADGIVHAMMQHASDGSGQREQTDVNQLVAEHIDLAYHGKRAQVSDLKVEIKRNLSVEAGMVEVVPQEIGRVLLNLLGNAFDAVQGVADPKVTVTTQRVNGQVEIRVSDNGPGIPAEIREKIFEPFFTTKPTGSGTGLGLSLSYDIITQGHGGALTVEGEEGEGATFIVTLPQGH